MSYPIREDSRKNVYFFDSEFLKLINRVPVYTDC